MQLLCADDAVCLLAGKTCESDNVILFFGEKGGIDLGDQP